MPGHAPYLMPDGQPLTRYLTLEDEKRRKRRSRTKKGSHPRSKDVVWNQLLLASARLKGVEGMDPAAVAELQSVQRVGHRRRRRWFNDRLLRDMAGPMTAKEMEAHFNPPPWGEEQKPSLLSILQSESDVWEVFRNIDMDKEARILKRWEEHNAKEVRNKKQKATPRDYAREALDKWAGVDKDSRIALKRSNPHTILEMEMQIMDLVEKDSVEPLQVSSKSHYTTDIWRGLAQFHDLQCSENVLKSDESSVSELTIFLEEDELVENDKDSAEGSSKTASSDVVLINTDLLEITCTDILLAIQEYRYTGLNVDLLARFVVTQIHGLDINSALLEGKSEAT